MMERGIEPRSLIGFGHRLVERLTAAKTRVWMLRQRLRHGDLDPVETEKKLEQIEQDVDDAVQLATNLHEQVPPPP